MGFLSSHAGDGLGLVVVLLERQADGVGQTALHRRLAALVHIMAVVEGKADLAIAKLARFLPDRLSHIFASRCARRLQVTAVFHPFHNGLHMVLVFLSEGAIFWGKVIAYLPRPFGRGALFKSHVL